jgi:hypothetical protein
MALHGHFSQFRFGAADEAVVRDFEKSAARAGLSRRDRDLIYSWVQSEYDPHASIDQNWNDFATKMNARGISPAAVQAAGKYHDYVVQAGLQNPVPTPQQDSQLAEDVQARRMRGEDIPLDLEIQEFDVFDRQDAASKNFSAQALITSDWNAEVRQRDAVTHGISFGCSSSHCTPTDAAGWGEMLNDPNSEYYTGQNRHQLQAEHLKFIEAQQRTPELAPDAPASAAVDDGPAYNPPTGTVPDHPSGNDAAQTEGS